MCLFLGKGKSPGHDAYFLSLCLSVSVPGPAVVYRILGHRRLWPPSMGKQSINLSNIPAVNRFARPSGGLHQALNWWLGND